MPEVINWRIISHPMNWVIVFFMVFIFVIAIYLIMGRAPKPNLFS